MPQYKLSKRARDHLLDIYERSYEMFGIYQADAYHAGLESTFQLLAQFPGIGRFADEIRPGYRRHRYQSHYIFYTLGSDHIVIRNIIHAARNLRPELFD
jgi:toxin ParE1/3/4